MLDLNSELAALQEQLPADVLDTGYEAFQDQENYQDASGPTPPPTGNYELKLEKAQLRKKDGKLILTDGKWPIFAIQSATIVGESQFDRTEGTEATGGGLGEGRSRKIGLLHDVRTQPFQRGGGPVVSHFIDLLRAFDVTQAGISKIDEGVALLVDYANQGKTFRVRLDWSAEDYQARNKELARYGETPDEQKAKLSKEAYNRIYEKYRAKSMRDFPVRPKGGHDGNWISPSGTPIEARLKIVRFYPSTDTVRLGPDQRTN